MESSSGSSFFPNDGSFLERFKQLQQEQSASDSTQIVSPASETSPNSQKANISIKRNITVTSGLKGLAPSKPAAPLSGKLAFSLKPKSKPLAPAVKLSGDDEEEDGDKDEKKDTNPQAKKQRVEKVTASTGRSSDHKNSAIPPPPPVDPEVKKVADKLANFVAKNGRQFENVTRQKNPGDTPFRFLFDVNCADYKYYEYRLSQEQLTVSADEDHPEDGVSSASSRQPSVHQKSASHVTNYQTPAAALYASASEEQFMGRRDLVHGGSHMSSADSLAMMEYYMNKAAREDLQKPPRQAKDEMPPPASLHAPGPPTKKGHHMGDYIPPEEMEKFLAKCNDAYAHKYSKEAAEKAKIQADNVGHRLLSKMGWKEGEGLGSGKSGRSDPVQAGTVKVNNLGVGAEAPGEVTPDDDIYEQYKKRMMLGYRFRPNPLNNPRKAYY